ncbi:MAG: NAD-dependent epimerase/dehydratase family protein [Vicinamibacteria bacterium]|nr:NAD-dependent epimerase/dehydratase family protein [Vicinamibacteria bacterium]
MRVALTGATGFVGRSLVRALLAEDNDLVCLARSEARADVLRSQGCAVVIGDLENEGAIERLVEGTEAVIHLAGLVSARSESEFLRINATGSLSVARAAKNARVRRFIFISSLAATGPAARGEMVDEQTSPRPVTPYGRSKLAGEEAVRTSGVPFTIARPSAVYGPHDREFLRLFRLARIGVAPLIGNGRQELSLVHSDDLARALVAMARTDTTEGRLYHVCHPAIATQRDLAAAIGRAVGRRARTLAVPIPIARTFLWLSGAVARITGRPSVLSPDKAPELLAPAWTCSSAALTRDTGWKADIALDRGLAETAAWYRGAGWL